MRKRIIILVAMALIALSCTSSVSNNKPTKSSYYATEYIVGGNTDKFYEVVELRNNKSGERTRFLIVYYNNGMGITKIH